MKPLYWWLFANLWVQHFCKYSPEQGWGWMCSLLLSEVSSYACIISTQCTHEACGYQVWGRFIMKMLVSPPSWWTGLKETKKKSISSSYSNLVFGEGSTSLVIISSSWCSWPKVMKFLVTLDFLNWNTTMCLLISSHAGETPPPPKAQFWQQIAQLWENNRVLEAH